MAGADYSIRCGDDGRAALSGVLRLASPAMYNDVFVPVMQAMAATEGVFEIDLSGLRFMNSSGISALSHIVLQARRQDRKLRLRIDPQAGWQKKTAASLTRLHAGVEVVGG